MTSHRSFLLVVSAGLLTLAAPSQAWAQQATGRYLSQEECTFRELPRSDYVGYRRRRSGSSGDVAAGGGIAVMNDEARTLVEWARSGTSSRPAVVLRAARGMAFTGAMEVSAGFGDACAVTAMGEVWCWGDNVDGTRGTWESPTSIPRLFLRTATGPAFVALPGSLAMGYAAGCGTLASDRTAWCWGYNSSGMNGHGSFDTIVEPRQVIDTTGATFRDVRFFSITRSAVCAVRTDDTVWCWGSVGLGALLGPIGGPSVARAGQVMLDGSPFTAAVLRTEDANDSDSTSDFPTHACVVRPDGSVWCWGRNVRGALGSNTTADRATPAPVLENGMALRGAATTSHALAGTCVLMADSTVRCWGDNQYGQVGDGTTTQRLQAVPVLGEDGRPLDGFTQIASLGTWTRCGLRRDNTLWCWGRNLAGQLGDGTTTNRSRPQRVTCGECRVDSECALGPDPYADRFGRICDGERMRCGECVMDSQCTDTARPLCDRSDVHARCAARSPNGMPPAAGRACSTATPSLSTGCASGVCDTDSRCGLLNGSEGCMGMNARCRSDFCAPDGRCGAPLGSACTRDAQCREGVCNAADGMSGICVRCNARNAAMVCTGATPVCDTTRGECVSCTGDQGTPRSMSNTAPCPDTAQPFCSAEGSCRRCMDNAECRAVGRTHAGPICGAMGACGEACRSNADCDETRWCATPMGADDGMCAPRAANGAPIPSTPGSTAPGPCADGASTRCTSGVCDSDGRCGRSDGATCRTSADCRMLECLMGVCGGPRVEAGVDASADVTPEAATDVASVVDAPAAPDVASTDATVVVDTPPTQDVVTAVDATVMTDVVRDGGTTAQQNDGCGCRAHGRSRSAPWLLWAALVAAMRKRRSLRIQPSAR